MLRDTERALKDSIKHWEENALASAPENVRIFSDSCALCFRFRPNPHVVSKATACRRWISPAETRRERCPVFRASGNVLCLNTPWRECGRSYELWKAEHEVSASYTKGSAVYAEREHFRRAAKRLTQFLEGLLP